MRDMSRDVIARDASGRVEEAACRGAGSRWTELEARHEAARTSTSSAAVVNAARKEFCFGCQALAACHSWAEIEQYDGLAAGAAYSRGRVMPAEWISGRPGRPGRRGQEQAAS